MIKKLILILKSKLDLRYEIDQKAKDHHASDWYLEYFSANSKD